MTPEPTFYLYSMSSQQGGNIMKPGLRSAVIIVAALSLEACVKLGHIQQTEPVRTTRFTGSHKAMAQCVHQRLGGKLQEEALGERYVIYEAVKGKSSDGLTHYAITVRRLTADEGSAEWRVMATPTHGTGTGRYPAPKLSNAAVEEYWTPVQECAARVKGSQ